MEKMVKMLVRNPKAATRWFARSRPGTEVEVPENAAADLVALGVAVMAPEPEPQPEQPEIAAPEPEPEDEPKNYSDDQEAGPEIVSQSLSQPGEDEPPSL